MLTFRDTISDGESIASSVHLDLRRCIMNFYDPDDEDNFYTRLMGFEQSCMEEADPMFFREAGVFSFVPRLVVVSAADQRFWTLVSECDPQRRVPGGHGGRRLPVPLAAGRSNGILRNL